MIFLKNIYFYFKKRALIFIALFVLFNNSLLSSVLPDVKSKSIWISEEYLLDTNKVEPLTSIAETKLKLRNDEIKSKNIREQILKNSPNKNKDFFVVPKVVE